MAAENRIEEIFFEHRTKFNVLVLLTAPVSMSYINAPNDHLKNEKFNTITNCIFENYFKNRVSTFSPWLSLHSSASERERSNFNFLEIFFLNIRSSVEQKVMSIEQHSKGSVLCQWKPPLEHTCDHNALMKRC